MENNVNLSEIGTNYTDDNRWSQRSEFVQLSGILVSTTGLILNYLCYITADQLSSSNASSLMKYLAFWDALNCFQNGILNLGFGYFGFSIYKMDVSFLNFGIKMSVSLLNFGLTDHIKKPRLNDKQYLLKIGVKDSRLFKKSPNKLRIKSLFIN